MNFLSKATIRTKLYLSNKNFFVEVLDFEQNIFGLFTRSFWAWLLELHPRVHSNVFTKNIFFEKKVSSPNLLSVAGTFPCFRRKIYGRVDKSAFFCPKDLPWKTNFLKKYNLQIIYGFWKIFTFEIWHEASTEMPKLHILC